MSSHLVFSVTAHGRRPDEFSQYTSFPTNIRQLRIKNNPSAQEFSQFDHVRLDTRGKQRPVTLISTISFPTSSWLQIYIYMYVCVREYIYMQVSVRVYLYIYIIVYHTYIPTGRDNINK